MDDFSISSDSIENRRDSTFFSCHSEEVDTDDELESYEPKNPVYNFKTGPNVLVNNKGQTRRKDWPNLGGSRSYDNNIKHTHFYASERLLNGPMNATLEVEKCNSKPFSKKHTNFPFRMADSGRINIVRESSGTTHCSQPKNK